MSDEELPFNDELASAYLDGDLDPAERATASADPEVMASVENFARVRSMLSDVAPVDGIAQDNALAAALAEFDALHVAAAVSPTATVTSLRSHRRTYRALTSVAAAVAILAIGVAAINGTRGNDDKSSSAVERNAASAGTISPAAADAPSLKVSADTAAAAGTAAPAAAESVAAATGDASAGATTATPPQVDTKAALAEYAQRLQSISVPAPQSPSTTTQVDNAFGSAPLPCLTSRQVVVGGPITVNGTLAYAIRDTSNGDLQALDATDCTVLLEVPGP